MILCWIRVLIRRSGKKLRFLRFHNTVWGAFQLMRINENPDQEYYALPTRKAVA